MPIDSAAVPPIVVDRVSKTFRVPEERSHTLKERVLHPRRNTRRQVFKALDDVSFDVRKGEFFGIAGRNGSGKSTLLKCLAGIYGVDSGGIWLNGRMSTFIELGVGFNADLAARDNVVLNGIMMGLSPREARARYDAVIDFAELREFEELKLKNYSSGMHVRLAFAVAIQVDAEILLVDEVLAVGDAAFQQKCFEVFNQMRDSGRTIVFVSHDMGAMNRFCDRVLLLERGAPVHLGDPQEVADRYFEINFSRDEGAGDGASGGRAGDGAAEIVEVWAEDETGERKTTFAQGRQMTLKARVSFKEDVEDPAASVFVLNEDHLSVMVGNSAREDDRSGHFAAGDEAVFEFSFENVLAPGRYNPLFMLAHRGSGLDLIDRLQGAVSFITTATLPLGGVVDLPVQTRVSRGADAESRIVR